MDGVKRRVGSVRGSRRGGRGVRVRGGTTAPPAVNEQVPLQRRRGGRGSHGAHNMGPWSPWSISIEELLITPETNMSVSPSIEQPQQPKRKRSLEPTNLDSALPPSTSSLPPTTTTSSTQEDVVMVEGASVCSVDVASPLSPVYSVSSPEMFAECGESARSTLPASPMQRQRSRPSQNLRSENINKVNYGSEASSGESDDEQLTPYVPRTYVTELETPNDVDETFDHDFQSTQVTYEGVTTEATEQPHSLMCFDWKPFPNSPISPQSRRETFSQTNVGPTTPCADPYDIFVAIWDRQFMEHIASETNRYAQQVAKQMFDNHSLQPTSRISKWYDTTPDELYTYFAVVIAMGAVIKGRIDDYWNAAYDILRTPGFSAYMSISRFQLLNKCLHFANNEDMCALELDSSEAKLFKIKPVLSHLNNKFSTMYNLSQNIALDESLLQWKGWLSINQLIPNKAATIGIKTYEICESQTGYLWRFEIHAPKTNPSQQLEDPLNKSTPSIVLRLIHGLEHKGHTLWMDNYYNSPILARRLKSIGFDCAGTLRTNREFVPQALYSLTKENMRLGDFTGLTAGDVDVMVWRDANRVGMLSTYHGNAVDHRGGSSKPVLILDYNIMMGGVDKKDQMLAAYPVERKRTRVWYKKLFKRLLNVSILNSYIIHKHSSQPLTHRIFRSQLIQSLLSHHYPRSVPPPVLPKIHPTVLPPKQKCQITITHRISLLPVKNKQRLRRKCMVCRKLISSFCVGCNKTACIEPCFVIMHS